MDESQQYQNSSHRKSFLRGVGNFLLPGKKRRLNKYCILNNFLHFRLIYHSGQKYLIFASFRYDLLMTILLASCLTVFWYCFLIRQTSVRWNAAALSPSTFTVGLRRLWKYLWPNRMLDFIVPTTMIFQFICYHARNVTSLTKFSCRILPAKRFICGPNSTGECRIMPGLVSSQTVNRIWDSSFSVSDSPFRFPVGTVKSTLLRAEHP